MSASNIARTGKQRKYDRREGEVHVSMYASKNPNSHREKERKRNKEKAREWREREKMSIVQSYRCASI